MKQSAYLFLITMALFSCQSATENTTEQAAEDTTVSIEMDVTTDGIREPNDEEIREYGIISKVEDGVYPMFLVTVEFPERQTKATFNLNVGTTGIDELKLSSLTGKYATIYYTVDMKNNLTEMLFNKTSLMYDDALKIRPDFKVITGKLSGAETVTESDLPGVVTVTAEDGAALDFEYYIDTEMMAANGKTVTAYYTVEPGMQITYLQPSETE